MSERAFRFRLNHEALSAQLADEEEQSLPVSDYKSKAEMKRDDDDESDD